MKKCVFLMLLVPCLASAQSREVVEATSGEDISKKVSTQIQYLFPEFTDGNVYYRGLPGNSGKLNYNTLVGEMQFVENDKIMALANVKDVVAVNIKGRKFFPFKNNEFAEELMLTAKCRLMVRYRGNVVQHSKKGAYGTYSSTSSSTSYSSINDGNQQYGLSISENVLVSVTCYYYLVGTNGKYSLIKNVISFTKQFPEHKAQIETFVKTHKTQFNNSDDLKSLLEYCSGLE